MERLVNVFLTTEAGCCCGRGKGVSASKVGDRFAFAALLVEQLRAAGDSFSTTTQGAATSLRRRSYQLLCALRGAPRGGGDGVGTFSIVKWVLFRLTKTPQPTARLAAPSAVPLPSGRPAARQRSNPTRAAPAARRPPSRVPPSVVMSRARRTGRITEARVGARAASEFVRRQAAITARERERLTGLCSSKTPVGEFALRPIERPERAVDHRTLPHRQRSGSPNLDWALQRYSAGWRGNPAHRE